MPDFRIVNPYSNLPIPPRMIDDLCDASRQSRLRDVYGVEPPMQVHINHGHYGATLLRLTWRERLAAWWYAHRWPLLRGALWCLAWLGLFLALNLLLDAGNALADWVSAL